MATAIGRRRFYSPPLTSTSVTVAHATTSVSPLCLVESAVVIGCLVPHGTAPHQPGGRDGTAPHQHQPGGRADVNGIGDEGSETDTTTAAAMTLAGSGKDK